MEELIWKRCLGIIVTDAYKCQKAAGQDSTKVPNAHDSAIPVLEVIPHHQPAASVTRGRPTNFLPALPGTDPAYAVCPGIDLIAPPLIFKRASL